VAALSADGWAYRSWLVKRRLWFSSTFGVNTAIVALIGISFLMSRDGELPPGFQKLKRIGRAEPGFVGGDDHSSQLVLTVSDVSGWRIFTAVAWWEPSLPIWALAAHRKLGLVVWERTLMFVTFLIMLASSFTFCGQALGRVFRWRVLVVGFDLRGLAAE